MIPSVSGGLGHVSRTAALARAIARLAPAATVEYLLDSEKLRHGNLAAVEATGLRVRLLPPLLRDRRDALAREFLGDADAVVEDTQRHLIPLRAAAPRPAWVSVPMFPLFDEIFMEWPMLAQADAVLWPYAPIVERPPELDLLADRLHACGPFLELDDTPTGSAARARLRRPDGQPVVVYAPRNFPFGAEFGHRVLGAVFGACAALRAGRHPGLRLELLAVTDPALLRGVAGVPDPLPDWVRVRGMVPRAEALLRMAAADALVAEGSSTMHEGAALRAPLVLLPGPIGETLGLARALRDAGVAPGITEPSAIDAAAVAEAVGGILDHPERAAADAARALTLVTAGGGAPAAARLVLDLAAARRGGLPLPFPLPSQPSPADAAPMVERAAERAA